jgi:hypothetical protein
MDVVAPSEALPDVAGEMVAVDTEGSGLHTDDGARVSIVSRRLGLPVRPGA